MEAPCLFQPLAQEEKLTDDSHSNHEMKPSRHRAALLTLMPLSTSQPKRPNHLCRQKFSFGRHPTATPSCLFHVFLLQEGNKFNIKAGPSVDCRLGMWHNSKKEKKPELDTQTETTLKVKFLCSVSSLCISGDTPTPTPTHTLFLHPCSQTSLSFHQPEKAHWLNKEAKVTWGKLDLFFLLLHRLP